VEQSSAMTQRDSTRFDRVLAVAMVGLGAAILVVLLLRVLSGPRTPAPAVLGSVVDFTLTDQNGQTVTKQDLLGKVWIADFIFTSCSGTCPIMTKTMVELQGKLTDVRDLRLVSVSVDPARDTPEVMAGYASYYKADPKRWFFLTGEEAEIRKLVTDSFKLMSGENLLFHSERLSIVDRKGRVRTGYDGTKPESLDRIVADVRAIAKER